RGRDGGGGGRLGGRLGDRARPLRVALARRDRARARRLAQDPAQALRAAPAGGRDRPRRRGRPEALPPPGAGGARRGGLQQAAARAGAPVPPRPVQASPVCAARRRLSGLFGSYVSLIAAWIFLTMSGGIEAIPCPVLACSAPLRPAAARRSVRASSLRPSARATQADTTWRWISTCSAQ